MTIQMTVTPPKTKVRPSEVRNTRLALERFDQLIELLASNRFSIFEVKI